MTHKKIKNNKFKHSIWQKGVFVSVDVWGGTIWQTFDVKDNNSHIAWILLFYVAIHCKDPTELLVQCQLSSCDIKYLIEYIFVFHLERVIPADKGKSEHILNKRLIKTVLSGSYLPGTLRVSWDIRDAAGFVLTMTVLLVGLPYFYILAINHCTDRREGRTSKINTHILSLWQIHNLKHHGNRLKYSTPGPLEIFWLFSRLTVTASSANFKMWWF